jgi:hypothetical protein
LKINQNRKLYKVNLKIIIFPFLYEKKLLMLYFSNIILKTTHFWWSKNLGKGQNVKNQNVKSLKKNIKSLKIWKGSERWKSLCRKSNLKFENFRRSDFTYGVRKNQNVKNRKEQLPMVYCLCVPRPVGVRLKSIRLGWVRLGWVRLGKVRLHLVRLD